MNRFALAFALSLLLITQESQAQLITIGEVYAGGGQDSTATYASDYITLLNTGTGPVTYSGLSLQIANSNGSFSVIQLKDFFLEEGKSFLIGGTGDTGGGLALPNFDLGSAGLFNLSTQFGQISLFSGGTFSETGVNTGGSLLGSLNYGTGTSLGTLSSTTAATYDVLTSSYTITGTPVAHYSSNPEPSSLVLLGLTGLGFVGIRLRRQPQLS